MGAPMIPSPMKPICMGFILHIAMMPRVACSLQCGYAKSNGETRGTKMTEKDKVLSANLEFYRAFAMGDEAAMDPVWARPRPVSCTHPAWMVSRERGSVLRPWENIRGGPDA